MFLPFFFGVIFYWQATGEIYGVHKDLATAPPVPAGVASISVPETPDKIVWPIPARQTKGREQWSAVDPVTKILIVKPGLSIPIDPDEELIAAIEKATTLQELKNALIGKLGLGKVKGKPIN